jgi:DNA-directed RNA polymerase specialized sigma24 family protein
MTSPRTVVDAEAIGSGSTHANERGVPTSEEFVKRATVTVHAVLRRKSGMSLREDDKRAANLDAIEICHDVIARLWERHVDGGAQASELTDVSAFAATIAHNAWSDHL